MKKIALLMTLIITVLLVNGQVVHKYVKPIWQANSKQHELNKDTLKKSTVAIDSMQAHVRATDCARCGKRDIMPLHRCSAATIKERSIDLKAGAFYALSDGIINGQKRVLNISEIKALLKTSYSEHILKYILEYNPDALVLKLIKTDGNTVSVPLLLEKNGYIYIDEVKANTLLKIKGTKAYYSSGKKNAYVGHVTLLR
ncbi:MAG: hypothetical protein RIR12_445 [Bacteroidota bacterium]|jgi:hypothetical protein